MLKTILKFAIQFAMCAAIPVVGCSIGAAIGAVIDGGSLKDALKAFASAFVSQGIFSGISDAMYNLTQTMGFAGGLLKAGIHGVIGGALSVAQGGSFLQGFAGGAAGAMGGYLAGESGMFGEYRDGVPELQMARALISAAAGCIGAAISGGKCGEAAMTAAMGSLFNGDAMSQAGEQDRMGELAFAQKCGIKCSGAVEDASWIYDVFGGAYGIGKALVGQGISRLATHCFHSFDGETRVTTRNGRKRLKDLREGEEVWARDEATGEMAFRPIIATHVNSYDETVTLVIRDAATGELQTIVSNRLHPYFVSLVAPQVHLVANGPTLRGTLTTGRFVEAQHIEAGAWLVTENGLEAEVVGKTIARAPLTAYNLTVAEFETFFVSGADNDNAPAVWVHNCSPEKLHHLFGQAKHGFDDLLRSFGGDQKAAFRAIESAANSAYAAGSLNVGKNGILPRTGSTLNVNGFQVQLSGGRIIDGSVQIGSASARIR